jgi:hypothetical protein
MGPSASNRSLFPHLSPHMVPNISDSPVVPLLLFLRQSVNHIGILELSYQAIDGLEKFYDLVVLERPL